MNRDLINYIYLSNPWLKNASLTPTRQFNLITRLQLEQLESKTWDKLWTVLIGPRQAGKTTLGYMLCDKLIREKRFNSLLYLNCDELLIRSWLTTPLFISEATDYFNLNKPIIFIDEVQRLPNPGLLLKNIIDLQLPIKLIATGSSQLEIKSKVQEYLTGRQLEMVILPLSQKEIPNEIKDHSSLIYGSYPEVVKTPNINEKKILLQQLFNDYINKDIIEFLKVGNPDIMQKLIVLIAHSSGQLINYQSLATDLQVSVTMIKNYLSLLERTYTLSCIKPFVGSKRKEITSNPVYYFIDNGFRNQALNNFTDINNRTDSGLLFENMVFQEILKYKNQILQNFTINYWRTQSGAEVDFILNFNQDLVVPIEVKYRKFTKPVLSRSFHSFITAYNPKVGFVITKDYYAKIQITNSVIHFIPLDDFEKIFDTINKGVSHT